ncbi:MAG: exodeoxyribonuclease V subunit alpha, partial [Desulfobulbales bacterium]
NIFDRVFMNISPILQELQPILANQELFLSLDRHFAMFIGRIAQKHSAAAAMAGALVSRRTGEGNICLDLAEYAGKSLHPDLPGKPGSSPFVCPPLAVWEKQLMQSGVVGHGEGDTPLVLDGTSRLYLRRYWQYENFIIRFIRQRGMSLLPDLNITRLRADLKQLFSPRSAPETDWQQVAAIAAVSRPFTVISGGPGTGKTTTVAKILALLQGQRNTTKPLRILLGAPTGKAASRLQQAIAASGAAENRKESLPARTLHRMLGAIPDSPYFLYNEKNPLPAEVIIIDEVSMVDLPLLAKLMQAVPATARLILLGDRNQLASVQPGSVLGDIRRAEVMTSFSHEFRYLVATVTGNYSVLASASGLPAAPPPLEDSFVELIENYRFNPQSDIARLSMAVQKGDGEEALDILLYAADGSIGWSELPDPAALGRKLQTTPGVSQFEALQQAVDPDSCFDLLNDFRILCALRGGPYGMERINGILEHLLAPGMPERSTEYYPKPAEREHISPVVRPVMVTRNDYNLQLFNGDVGIMLPDRENQDSLRTFFPADNGTLRHIAPSLLPGHETVFAMTVHKSQGSEFNRVLLILPDQDSPLLTRELLYTAITRARGKVDIWSNKAIFTAAVERRIRRTSGLTQGLWGGDT